MEKQNAGMNDVNLVLIVHRRNKGIIRQTWRKSPSLSMGNQKKTDILLLHLIFSPLEELNIRTHLSLEFFYQTFPLLLLVFFLPYHSYTQINRDDRHGVRKIKMVVTGNV